MRTLAAMVILGALMNSVEAAPINLRCQGLTEVIHDYSSVAFAKKLLSLSIDVAEGTVTVVAYDNAWAVPIVSDPNDDIVTFMPVSRNVTSVGVYGGR